MRNDFRLTLSEEDLLLFKVALSRRKEIEFGHAGYHYDPCLHYVCLEDHPLPHQFVQALLHEFGHSRLGESIFGMTIETLFSLAGVIGETLCREHIDPLSLGILDSLSDAEHRLVTKLERTLLERQTAKVRVGSLFEANKDGLWALARSNDFVRLARALRLVDRRRRAMLSVWKVCQEGYATFVQVSVNSNVDDHYAGFIADFFPMLSDQHRRQVRKMVSEAVVSLQKQLLHGTSRLPQHYRDGYILFDRIARECEDVVAPFWAARLAAHFPYYACDILAVDDRTFEQMLTSFKLNIDGRLKRLAANPRVVSQAKASPEGMRDALAYLLDGQELEPLGREAICFDEWEMSYLYGSKVVCQALGFDDWPIQNPWSPGGPSHKDFRFCLNSEGKPDYPPVLTPSGRIMCSDELCEAVFVKQYIRYWRMADTLCWLRRLEELLGIQL